MGALKRSAKHFLNNISDRAKIQSLIENNNYLGTSLWSGYYDFEHFFATD